ncbi:MAG: hypothetical protein A2Y15_04645 [Clostridiales bacterium GWF2_36_10]|nr:MAG: hypothetical protein A2Y15_04645 [Clostridiales bacterium GWF2_36_10]HAN20879.1 hypothetical protein [Clostridiales bacterium]
MNQTLVTALVNNAALLLVLSVIYEFSYLLPIKYKRFEPIINGILISIICIAIMLMPFKLQPGLVFDTRSILISVTALIFGSIPTIITATVAAIYRIIVGGSGTIPGLTVIAASALIGLAWRKWLYPKSRKLRSLNIYTMSIVVHITMLACMLLHPDRFKVIKEIALPVLLIYPIASILLSLLLIRQQERRRYQEQLKESEERFQLLFNKAPLGYQSLDINGYFIDVNQQWLDTLGYTREEVIGKWFGNFLTPFCKEGFIKRFSLIKAQGKIHSEFEMLHKNGTILTISFDGKIGLDYNGDFKQTHCILRDITEHKKVEEALITSEMRYRRLFEASKDGIIILDATTGIILDINPFITSLLGYKKEQLINKLIWETDALKDIIKDLNDFFEILQKDYNYFEDLIIKKANGQSINIEFISIAYLVKSQKLIQCNIRDVTDRKRTENDLLESEKKYSNYIENAPDGIFVVNEKGQFIDVNKATITMTGYSKDELLHTNIKDITFKDSLHEALQNFMFLLKTGSMKTELRYKHKNGTIRWWRINSVKLTENQFLGFASDITDRKKAQDDLVYLIYHDYLTGLYNRKYYEEIKIMLDKEYYLPISILIADINGVRLINDAFGYAEGDKLIKETSIILQKCCRKEDVLARIGGDEFVIIMPNTNNEEAYKMFNLINKECDVFNENHKIKLYEINLSIGFCTKNNSNVNIEETAKMADEYLRNQKLLNSKSFHSNLISSIMATVYEKSQETEEHAKRLSVMSKKIGEKLNLPQKTLGELELLSVLHDIGKAVIDDAILNKPGKLTEDEWIIMKKHPEIGYRIAKASSGLEHIADYILAHHERWDGEGYPHRLKGEAIPLLSRILSIVDAYDAMTNDRVYRKAMTEKDAINEIIKNAGTQFDPQIVEAFEKIMCVQSFSN